jgi:hypothetical protein
MKNILFVGIAVLISLSSCSKTVLKPLPPGQVKKTTAPGQVKKTTGSQSAAPYAPGQQKKTPAGKAKKN